MDNKPQQRSHRQAGIFALLIVQPAKEPLLPYLKTLLAELSKEDQDEIVKVLELEENDRR